MSKTISPAGVVSYPNLFKPRTDPAGRSKFSCTLIFKGGAGVDELRKAVDNVLADKFPDGKIPPRLRMPFRDGAEYEDKDGYEEGDVFVQFSRNADFGPPVVVGPDCTPIDQSMVYPGCVGRVSTKPFYWHHQESNKRGVSLSLEGFQFVRDGEPIGGFAPPSADDFEVVS